MCPDCKKMMHAIRCEGSPKIFGLNVLPYETALQGLPNRTEGNISSNTGRAICLLKISFRSYNCDQISHVEMYISECLLENIGKPVFHRYTQDLFGSWMQVGYHFNKSLP